MRKILLLLLSIFLTGCNYYYEDGIASIRKPDKLVYDMDGSWKLIDVKKLSGESIDRYDQYSDRAFFKGEMVYLEDIYSREIDYSLKNVDARDYLLSKYRYNLGRLDHKRIKVYSLKIGQDYLTELIGLEDNKLAYFKDGNFLIYEREKDQVDQEEIQAYLADRSRKSKGIHKLEDRGNIGFILGLKQKTDRGYSYTSRYIKIVDEKNIVDFKAENLLLPRKNGFYRISQKDDKASTTIELDYLDKEGIKPRGLVGDKKHILYVGNDFISVETQDQQGNKSLGLYSIDYLEEARRIRLKDILDEISYELVEEDLYGNKELKAAMAYDDRNFGLKRSQGHWNLFARLKKQDGNWQDFKIRALPPKSLVRYDDMPILWNSIQNQLGPIEDGYISPKGDYIVCRQGSRLDIYPIRKHRIEKTSVYSMELDMDQEIIMAEWATNIYSDLWAAYFKGE